VSVGTVSNVLNGTREVTEARRRRVLQAVNDLGFHQNMLAQALRRNSSSVIGLCVPRSTTSYFAALVDAFEKVAADRNFAIMQVLTHEDPATEHQRIQNLLRYRVDGIILVPSINPDATYELLEKSNTPLVLIDRPADDRGFDQVTFANRQAMYETGRQLIALGHRRILFCVQQANLSVSRQRRDGLNQAISEAPHPVAAEILTSIKEEAAFQEQIRLALAVPNPPTAIIVSNSTLAEWIVRGLERLDVRFPGDVSLLAFGEPHWADLITPKLSVVRQPIQEIAVNAWELLLRRMNGEETDPHRMEIEGAVIMRGSVGPPPAGSSRPRRIKLI
jgi:LacI family transcriptional regulator